MRLFLDTIKMAISSLLSKKIRSFLSVLGIVIGILTVSSLLSIALSVRDEIEGSITSLGSNLIDIVPGDIESSGFAGSFGTSTLTEEDFNDISQVSGAENVTMHMALTGTVRSGEKALPGAFLSASSPNFPANYGSELVAGQYYDDQDEQNRNHVVVLGSTAAEKLFGSASEAIGKTLEVRATEFEVIGVLAEMDLGFGGIDANNMVLMPIHTGWELTNTEAVTEITLQASNADRVQEVKEAVEATILENHNGEKDFSVLTKEDLLDTVGGVLDILTAMLGAIASISLLVGGVGIMNIMLVSVSERTREIGIRKAVGATRGAILLQFLIEGIMLTLLGGIIAVIFYNGVILALATFVPDLPIDFNLQVVLLSLAFSAVVGIIFGIAPAIGAARKDPIQSLKYE